MFTYMVSVDFSRFPRVYSVDIPWILVMGYEATLDGRKTSRLANHRLDV